MPDLRLRIRGADFIGWETAELSQSIEAVAGRFELTVSKLNVPFPVSEGDACQIWDGKDKLLDGWVDTAEAVWAGDSHSVTVTGRDKTGDLVDCSATNPTQEFLNISFSGLLQKLAAPFGVPVTVTVSGLAPFKKFCLQQESAFEAIERACRLRGVLPLPAAGGGLRVVPYGESRAETALVLGKNVLAATISHDFRERFSEYTVYGQQPGSDELDAEACAAVMGRAVDTGVKRYRPLTVMAEGAVSGAVARGRAEWEAAVRAARSLTTRVTVQGWRQREGGPHWRINDLVSASLPGLASDEADDFLIREVQRVFNGNEGSITHLTLTHKEAYLKKPDARETRKRRRRSEDRE